MQKFTRGYCCLGNGWEWGTGTIIVIMGFLHSRSEAPVRQAQRKLIVSLLRMEENHQLKTVFYPIIDGVSTMLLVVQDFHPQYVDVRKTSTGAWGDAHLGTRVGMAAIRLEKASEIRENRCVTSQTKNENSNPTKIAAVLVNYLSWLSIQSCTIPVPSFDSF